ncbi:hypothetical protein ASPWEDRAFT_34678 [Aspergillus wentii DTO 134E9]|uniref:Receptor L-domain domain-containing protein n=1 Tax=Aspergillus wentii DTO 134E9 TaxID=1073089 RepID=A0A1L9S1Z7_ASPWE|nr:uncharacterized protein ASPWEDRAFT_34678 [Aspergillus wentii DTO 134E9]KAI9923953.1 3-prime end of ExtraCellular Mutant protein [Aspergillus wentii]OJJ41179.1 hypothetical protein ASPWEDRAFT_34678 [Aspergillus wentii DTO 134E9]
MAFMKYVLPALAAGQVAMAASCGSGDTIKISSQGDADGYSSCKTLKGDVEIQKEITGSLSLNGIEQITGGLSCDGATNMSSLSASSLTSIGDTFKLNSLTTLTQLSFGSLTKVGSIQWTALPELQTLDFSKGVEEAGNVAITNTGLTDLDGISLKTVGQFDITENTNLKKVNVNDLTNATGLINFAGNMLSLEIDLPNLSSGTNMTFRNVSSVSVPSLHNLTGQLGFWGDTFKSFIAPNLTETGDLIFNDNSKLANLTLSQLKTVNGGFQIARNDKLANITFPKLEVITGALDFTGAFDDVSLPALKNVKGGFNMKSTGNFECKTFKTLQDDNVIHGKYACKAEDPNPTTKDGSSGSSTTTSGSASKSSDEGAGVAIGVNVPVLGAAAIFGYLIQYAL